MLGQHFFLARQPILDRNRQLVAYELLFRASQENRAEVSDDVAASAAVIQHAFLDLGMEEALGGKTAFINASEALLMSDALEVLPANHVVIELLETVRITAPLIERCRHLKAKGLRLALDDVIALDDAMIAILPLIDIIKVDMLAAPPEALELVAREAQRHDVKLLAEKVDTQEQFERCLAAGFALFQGYHFARPKMLRGQAPSASTLALLKLLELIASDAEIEELEEALKRNPGFTLKLLKMVNSAGLRRSGKISSLRQAILALGRIQINRLVQIMMFTQGSGETVTANPLAQMAVIRGRMMEGLAEACAEPELKPRAFMLGMLSLADALFGKPLEKLAEILSLDEAMRSALLRREGRLGQMLDLVEMTEHAQTTGTALALTQRLAAMGGGDAEMLNRLHLEALRWANHF
ncbi:EAL and HDOD domain-containing protein [Acidocella sp. KAb 2-4]|uniref:EAL and HDOD domain-containing protein n=1 Tax=Acidocella sp. KAb 2-4 TaxID=2885158 RepID=UPI001D0850EC|nr:EAL domain-containing protein [Acidocella sp. KAb 2-4]MCB5944060.1 EAL domain-containing protein [Acidocella sp. KAb 2-4]